MFTYSVFKTAFRFLPIKIDSYDKLRALLFAAKYLKMMILPHGKR